MHYAQHHVSFTQDVRNVHVTRMSASVNDSIHIKVKVVEFRQQSRVRDNLIDLCVALAEPAVKLSSKLTKLVSLLDTLQSIHSDRFHYTYLRNSHCVPVF